MAQSASLLILPMGETAGERTEAAEAAVPLLMQSVEDLRLAERVERALRETGHGALRSIKIVVQGRLARLEGRIPSYYLKQVAQTTTLGVPGIHQVRNDLEVSGTT